MLARQPKIQQKLRQELDGLQHMHEYFSKFEDFMNITPYLDAVIRESLCTKAVLREIGRPINDDIIPLEFAINGTNEKEAHVKAGQVIQIPIRDGLNADETIWGTNVTEFLPGRWLDDQGLPSSVNFIRAQGHLLTFGDGPKAYPGRTFAIAELKIVVSVLISHFQIEDVGLPLDFYHSGGNT